MFEIKKVPFEKNKWSIKDYHEKEIIVDIDMLYEITQVYQNHIHNELIKLVNDRKIKD
jgi:hypothetical protein